MTEIRASLALLRKIVGLRRNGLAPAVRDALHGLPRLFDAFELREALSDLLVFAAEVFPSLREGFRRDAARHLVRRRIERDEHAAAGRHRRHRDLAVADGRDSRGGDCRRLAAGVAHYHHGGLGGLGSRQHF